MKNVTSSYKHVRKLIIMSLLRFGSVIIAMAMILFLTAGSVNYWNAWLLLGSIFILVLIILSYLLLKDPKLLENRMKVKEKEKTQKIIIKLSIIPLIISIVIPGFDFRYQWSTVPVWLVVVASVIFYVGYLTFFIVIRQNSFASRIIELQEKQKLIDTGIYAIIRHPMYLSNILIFFSIPLMLGSFFSSIPMSLFLFVFYFRIKNEEEVLKEKLEGYREYIEKVRYRLIPFIW